MACVNYISCGMLETITLIQHENHTTATHTLCIWCCHFWQIQLWSATSFLQVDCNAICNRWWMYLKWICTPCSSVAITVLYYCHVSRGHDSIHFLSTLINFNLLVFWTVELQPTQIIILCHLYWLSCCDIHSIDIYTAGYDHTWLK